MLDLSHTPRQKKKKSSESINVYHNTALVQVGEKNGWRAVGRVRVQTRGPLHPHFLVHLHCPYPIKAEKRPKK